MKSVVLDYSKKKLRPQDYKIILEHCKAGWSFGSVNSKVSMSSGNLYAAVQGDKLINDIRKAYCPYYKHGGRK